MPIPKRSVADYLYAELTAAGNPPQGGACAGQIVGFPDAQVQQGVFDGEVDDAGLLDVARAACAASPVLDACRQFADDSLDEHTFLAGMTAAERSRSSRRALRTRHRKTVVQRMRATGVTVAEIMFYTGYPTRSIEADLAELAAAAVIVSMAECACQQTERTGRPSNGPTRSAGRPRPRSGCRGLAWWQRGR